jgi:hypothetical protein
VDLVRIGEWPLQNVNNVFIQLTADEEDILYIRPLSGQFFIEFHGFGAEPGELPTIRFEEARDFNGRPWLPERYECYPLYEIVAGGEYSGMLILDRVVYEFEYDDVLEEFTIVGAKKNLHEQFMTFLNVFGFDLQHDNLVHTGAEFDAGGPTTIPNILPQLADTLRERGRLAQVEVKNGYTDKESLKTAPYGITRESLENAISAEFSRQMTKVTRDLTKDIG